MEMQNNTTTKPLNQNKMEYQKVNWTDVYLGKFKWYRKLIGGVWYKHTYTDDAYNLRLNSYKEFWAKYGEFSQYTKVVEKEQY